MRKTIVLFLAAAVALPATITAQTKTPDPALYEIKVDGKTGFIDKTGKTVVAPRFAEIGYGWGEGLMGVKVGELWGFINDKGKMVIEPAFEDVGIFQEGMCKIVDEDDEALFSFGGKLGFIDKTGKVIIAPGKYESNMFVTNDFCDGLAIVEVDGKYGYIDKTGKEVISPRFGWATAFEKGVAAVQDAATEMYGVIDKTGKWIVPASYHSIGSFTSGVAPFTAEKDGLSGLISSTGKIIKQPSFKQGGFLSWDFNDGMGEVHRDMQYGFIDPSGNEKIALKYDKVGYWGEGLVYASTGGEIEGEGWLRTVKGGYGFLDKSGKTVIPHKFEDASTFSEGLCAVKQDGKWGYIDKTGKWVISPQWAELPGMFRNGLAKIRIKEGTSYGSPERIGYIDKTGKYVYTPTK